jgi:hypothetical protein
VKFLIETWLDLSPLPLVLVLALFYAASAGFIYWCVFASPFRARIQTLTGVAATFLGVNAVLFSLLTGFLANEIAQRNQQAAHAVVAEANALREIHSLSIASTSQMASIRAALHNYVESILKDEWHVMAHRGAAPQADANFGEVLRDISQPQHAELAGQAVHNALLNAAARAASARAERIALSSDHSSEIKWGMILVLGIITQIGIGLVHLERPRAHAAALAVFTTAIVVALSLIAMQDQPFEGPLQVSPAPLRHVLTLASAPG